MLRVVRHSEADEELAAAALRYEQRRLGRGDDFLEDFELALSLQRPRLIQGENRKLNFNRFPYAIVYELKTRTRYLKAVMHLHPRPLYWRQRQ